jgi:hypothetical protein
MTPTANVPEIICCDLAARKDNDWIIERMRFLQAARFNGTKHVVCCISGYDEDPRFLFHIPEARAFMVRLIALGFMSVLDVSSMLPKDVSPAVSAGLGALELWTYSQGRGHVTGADREPFSAALLESNRVCESHIGPFRGPSTDGTV